jgi:hypothetical protein
MMSKTKSKASYVAKYWFAQGYWHCMEKVDYSFSQELVDYYQDLVGVNIKEEYDLGFNTAETDKNRGRF